MGEDEPGHKSCSEEMEDSIGMPVVNGFLMVELGSFKDTTKTVCSDL